MPVYKSDNKNNVKNYRPIILLNIFSKIFESLIFDNLYAAVWNVIIKEQHGFVKGRSTITNLGIFSDFRFDVVYADISKAFDRVNHDILLKKINSWVCLIT